MKKKHKSYLTTITADKRGGRYGMNEKAATGYGLCMHDGYESGDDTAAVHVFR